MMQAPSSVYKGSVADSVYALGRDPPERWLRTLVVCAMTVFAAQVLLMDCLPLAGFISHTAADDAFYYFEIAQRFGDPVWPTYDGQSLTTGFHPLWEFVLVLVAQIVPSSPWMFARVAVLLSAVFLFVATLVLARVVNCVEGGAPSKIALALVVGSAGVARFGLYGMEGSLGLLLLAGWCSEASRPASRPAVAGLLAGLTVLARIDMILPLALGHIYLLVRNRRNPGHWLAASAAAAVVLLPFAAWNIIHTGHLTTISAATKSFASEEYARQAFGGKLTLGYAGFVVRDLFNNLAHIARLIGRGILFAPLGFAGGDYAPAVDARAHLGATLFGVLLLGAIGVGIARFFPLGQRVPGVSPQPRALLLWVFGAGSLLHIASCSVLIPGHAGDWYWGLEIGALLILCGVLFAHFPILQKPIVALAIVSTLASMLNVAEIATALARGRFDNRRSFGSAAIAVANYLDTVVEPRAQVGSRNGGIIAFAARRSVVNLDGLVNDWGFLEARQRGELHAWMRRHNIRYYADCVSPANQQEYARSVGLSPDEVTTLFRIDGKFCEGFVWQIVYR